jgi:hypothetical protein
MAVESLKQVADASEDRMRELASLARLVTFARNSARDLKAEFSTYCLDLALGSLLEELSANGVASGAPSDGEAKITNFMSRVKH